MSNSEVKYIDLLFSLFMLYSSEHYVPQQHNECVSYCTPHGWKPACEPNCNACHWASENGPLIGNKGDTDAASTQYMPSPAWCIFSSCRLWSSSDVVWHISCDKENMYIQLCHSIKAFCCTWEARCVFITSAVRAAAFWWPSLLTAIWWPHL